MGEAAMDSGDIKESLPSPPRRGKYFKGKNGFLRGHSVRGGGY